MGNHRESYAGLLVFSIDTMTRFLSVVTLRRFLVFAAISFWLGGFTFYASVVVPIGMKVLGSHLKQGFITQEVSHWLNVAGVGAILILGWNTHVLSKRAGGAIRFLLVATLAIIALIQIELFVLHPFLDRLLDVTRHRVTDPETFDLLHRIYLLSATVQWGAGMVHVLCVAVEGL